MFSGLRKFLPSAPFFDKVLHPTGLAALMQYFIKGRYGGYSQSQETNLYPFCNATMLDDRITGDGTKIFYPIGS